jgi:hypothetical protein
VRDRGRKRERQREGGKERDRKGGKERDREREGGRKTKKGRVGEVGS